MALSTRLCPITKAQRQWAFRECIDHFAFRLPKGRTTCMDCGYSWTLEQPIDTCSCPALGAILMSVSTVIVAINAILLSLDPKNNG